MELLFYAFETVPSFSDMLLFRKEIDEDNAQLQ